MPPYQKQGHGSRLYQSLYNDFCGRKEIREMTGNSNSDDSFSIDHYRFMDHPRRARESNANFLIFLLSIVEDPNEEFSDLRDKNDMKHLDAKGVFNDLQAPVKKDRIEQVAATYKLTKVRYFMRLPLYYRKPIEREIITGN